MKAINDYTAALFEIQEATITEKIIWKRNSLNSFVYKTVNKDLEDLILTLKRIDGSSENHYMFSLIRKDFESSEVMINLDTSTTDKELQEPLEELYNFIAYHVDIKSLEGLKEFIRTINKEGEEGTSILD